MKKPIGASAFGQKIHPVILAGGTGTRLWPMSRALYPKQLLPITSNLSLLQETVHRVTDSQRFSPPLILCNEEHRFIVAEQLLECGNTPQRIVVEPVGRNTAPAAAVASLLLADQDGGALLLVLPADHVIANGNRFLAAVDEAVAAARAGNLVTFGVKPTEPQTGYGYIRKGESLDSHEGCFKVDRFIEKPNFVTAQHFLAEGGYFWNSGMFLFQASSYLKELERLEPTMLKTCRMAVASGTIQQDFLRLDQKAFSAAPSKSIDHAVMEHTDSAVVVPIEIGWNDVGTWPALWEIGPKNKEGNIFIGDVIADQVRNSYLRSEECLLAVLGIEDVVVIATGDAILVAAMDRTKEIKELVGRLRTEKREEVEVHRKVYRPWGSYQRVSSGSGFQVKRIIVNPGAKLSLQMHRHRAEHWVVVSGTALVTVGEKEFRLHANGSTFIPPNTKHRLGNPQKALLELIEVQVGSYLGEDDIVRLEDIYGRASK